MYTFIEILVLLKFWWQQSLSACILCSDWLFVKIDTASATAEEKNLKNLIEEDPWHSLFNINYQIEGHQLGEGWTILFL